MGAPQRDGVTLLSAYLNRLDLSVTAFAKKAEVQRTTISRALNRERSMDIYAAAKIEKASEGEVPASSWALVKLKPRGEKPRNAA